MDDQLRRRFENPEAEFRPLQIIHGFDSLGAEADSIGRGLDAIAAAGCGGVVANVAWPGYLRDEAKWRAFLIGAEEARRRNLALWIYDEEGYPSGAAGGLTLEGHPQLEARGLICASTPVAPGEMARMVLPAGAEGWVCAVALLTDGEALAERAVLRVSGREPVAWRAPQAAHRRQAARSWTLYCFASHVMYEGTHATTNVFAKRRYVNLLDPEVGRRFVALTHEQYRRRMSAAGFRHVAATFTDEPSLIVAYHDEPEVPRPAAAPWSRDLPRAFAERAGYALEPHLPEIFFDVGPDFETVRCDFYRVVAELIADNFLGPIQEWCHENGVESSGHLLCEERLSWHVWFEGDLFRCLRRMDWPGIDILSSIPESLLAGDGFLTPKFVSSAAHLGLRSIVMSETSDYAQRAHGEAASLEQMAGTAGLQFALGVNLITSYYGWRHYGDAPATWAPASQPPQNAYRAYCDYVGRLAAMLRGGRHVCPAAVYYPVRSMQARFAPSARPYYDASAHGAEVAALDALVRELARGLLQRQVDFDFVDDRALAEAQVSAGSLCIADEAYRLLILPEPRVMECDALAAVVSFARAGGAVIGVGCLPTKAARSADAEEFARLEKDLRAAGVAAMSLDEALRLSATKALLEPRCPHVLALHRVRQDGRHVRLFTNTSPEACAVKVRLHASGAGWLCWPRTGAVAPCKLGPQPLSLDLQPYEAVLVVAPPQSEA
jgi:hypothetical protein